MKTRVISGVIGIVLSLLVLSVFNTAALNIVGIILYAITLYEIHHALKEKNVIWTSLLLFVAGAVVIVEPKFIFEGNPMLLMAVFAFCFASIVVFNFEKIEFKTVASNVAFGIYVLVGFYSICRLQIVLPYEKFGWDGAFLFVFSAVIAWGGDISAYFSGVLFGKHKLAPVLSPKKTVEGAIGGVIGSVVFTWLFLWAYSLIKPIAEGTNIVYKMDLKIIAIVGLVAFAGSIVGMIGDLFASAIKRQTGIKDYGNIMPGHGGIIDRFDSVFLVAPLISSMAGFIAAAGGIFYV